MPNSYFQFKQFRIDQGQCGMKVTTDACFMAAAIPVTPNKRLLDIGTGTGLLSLMLAQKAMVLIDAIEIDHAAFLQAKENFDNSPWSAQISLKHTSLQAFESTKPYDMIICNPPFFKNSQKGANENKNKALHASLLSMEDLANKAKEHLKSEGLFWVMYPEQEMGEFIEIAGRSGLYPSSTILLRNIATSPVFRQIVAFGFESPIERDATEVVIRDANGEYTALFRSYLSNYYLHF